MMERMGTDKRKAADMIGTPLWDLHDDHQYPSDYLGSPLQHRPQWESIFLTMIMINYLIDTAVSRPRPYCDLLRNVTKVCMHVSSTQLLHLPQTLKNGPLWSQPCVCQPCAPAPPCYMQG